MMSYKVSNWKVKVYDEYDAVIDEFVIEDCTEREAEKGAFSRVNGHADWTMEEVKQNNN